MLMTLREAPKKTGKNRAEHKTVSYLAEEVYEDLQAMRAALEARGREVTVSRFIEQAVQQYIQALRQSEALAPPAVSSRPPPQKFTGRQR